jgi:hypothetical protein
MYNSPSISVVLPILISDVFDAFCDIGILEPKGEQIEEVVEHIRHETQKVSLDILKYWKEQKKKGQQ